MPFLQREKSGCAAAVRPNSPDTLGQEAATAFQICYFVLLLCCRAAPLPGKSNVGEVVGTAVGVEVRLRLPTADFSFDSNSSGSRGSRSQHRGSLVVRQLCTRGRIFGTCFGVCEPALLSATLLLLRLSHQGVLCVVTMFHTPRLLGTWRMYTWTLCV